MKKAIEAYDYAIAINEQFSSAYFNKANSLAQLNKFEEAIEVYQDMVEVHANMTEALKIFVWEKLSVEELPKGHIEIVADPSQLQVFPQTAERERKRPKRVG